MNVSGYLQCLESAELPPHISWTDSESELSFNLSSRVFESLFAPLCVCASFTLNSCNAPSDFSENPWTVWTQHLPVSYFVVTAALCVCVRGPQGKEILWRRWASASDLYWTASHAPLLPRTRKEVSSNKSHRTEKGKKANSSALSQPKMTGPPSEKTAHSNVEADYRWSCDIVALRIHFKGWDHGVKLQFML